MSNRVNEEMWRKTHDINAYEPKFAIWCRFCDEDMVMRYSALFPDSNNLAGFEEAGAQIAYKCPSCGYHVRFNISDSKEYIDKILEMRHGNTHHHDFEKLSEDERVARQLEGLGYFGGRDEED